MTQVLLEILWMPPCVTLVCEWNYWNRVLFKTVQKTQTYRVQSYFLKKDVLFYCTSKQYCTCSQLLLKAVASVAGFVFSKGSALMNCSYFVEGVFVFLSLIKLKLVAVFWTRFTFNCLTELKETKIVHLVN